MNVCDCNVTILDKSQVTLDLLDTIMPSNTSSSYHVLNGPRRLVRVVHINLINSNKRPFL